MIFFAFSKRFDILNAHYLVRFKNQSDRKLFKTEDNMKNTKSLFGLTGIAVAALIISSSAQAQPRHHHGHLPHRDLFVALDIASLVADIFLPRTYVAPTSSVVVPQTTYVTPPSIPQTTYVTPTVPQTTYVTPTTVTQPVVTQPVVTQPVVTQPVVTTSVVTTPVVTAPSTVVYTTGGSYYYPRYYTPRFYGGPRYIAPPPPYHGFHGGFHGGPGHHHGGPRH